MIDIQQFESVPMGESLVVWSPQNLAIRMLNPVAAWMFDSARAGFDNEQMATMLSETFEIPLQTASSDVEKFYEMFSVAPHHQSSPSPEEASDFARSDVPGFDDLTQVALHLQFGDVVIKLVVPERKIEIWQTVFGHLIIDEQTADALADEPHYVVSVYPRDEKHFVVAVDDETWYPVNRIKSAITVAYWAISKLISGHRQWFAVLHGAALQFNDRLVLMPGQGFQGKTTFCAALLSQGANYFSDDLVPISDEGDRGLVVHPLALPLSVRKGSWDVLKSLGVDIDSTTRFIRNGHKIRFMPLAKGAVAKAVSAENASFVVPVYSPDVDLEITELSPERVFQYMIGTGSSLGASIDRPRMERLIEWISKRPAIELRYSNTRGALDATRDFLSQS